jgi:tRNA pseudouridine32 synthase/23S rRNA pseudouridine746 synthase
VQAGYADARVVHRLDMATSGLVIFARGLDAQRRLSRAFEMRQVEKHYEAWVDGLLEPADRQDPAIARLIDLPLAADWPRRPRQRVDLVSGRSSQTEVRVLEHDPASGRTRVQLVPRTGRTHQLRVHLASIGHAIVGDALYGASGDHGVGAVGGVGRDGGAGPTPAIRLMLHATQLAFSHPHTGLRCVWHSTAPF